MLIAMYDFRGNYDIRYVAGEVRNPAYVILRNLAVQLSEAPRLPLGHL